MVITNFFETLDGSWIYCYIDCILGRAPRTKETLPDFCENMDPDKWDTIMWYRVTRNPQEFREFTGYQRDPRVLGCHNSDRRNSVDRKEKACCSLSPLFSRPKPGKEWDLFLFCPLSPHLSFRWVTHNTPRVRD